MASVPEDVDTLSGPDPVLAEEAAIRLRATGPSCLPEVIPISDSFAFRVAGRYKPRLARLCGFFGEYAIAHIAEVIERGGYHEQVLAVAALRQLQYDLLSPSCSRIARLIEHFNIDVQQAAFNAVGQLGAYHLTGRMIELADERDTYRFEKLAVTVLQSMAWVCIKSRGGNDSEAFSLFGDYLASLRSTARRWESSYPFYFKALEAEFDRRSVDRVLTQWLTTTEPLLRSFALSILGELRVKRSIPAIVKMFHDSHDTSTLQVEAARVIGKIGGERAIEFTTTALFQPNLSSDARSALLSAYAELCYDTRQPIIDSILREISNNPEDRLMMTYSLALRQDERCNVEFALESDDYTWRSVGAFALGRLRGRASLPRLNDLLHETSHPIERASVLAAIVRAGDSRHGAALHDALCEWPLDLEPKPHQIAYQFRREFMGALLSSELPSYYAQAWSHELKVSVKEASGADLTVSPSASLIEPGKSNPESERSAQRREPEEYDLFISHASEDKASIARPLFNSLTSKGLSVWFDEATLKLGDSLRRKIDEGLKKCKFGVVIISPNFLMKEWPQRELDGLVAREIAGGKKAILPIWHGVSQSTVLSHSPTLGDRLAARSEEGIEALAAKIIDAIRQF